MCSKQFVIWLLLKLECLDDLSEFDNFLFYLAFNLKTFCHLFKVVLFFMVSEFFEKTLGIFSVLALDQKFYFCVY